MVEISMGTIDIELEERVNLVKEFSQDFEVLSEIGSKDGEAIMPPSVWINELNTLLDAGCKYVITEGRNSGTAGVYRPSGEIRTGLIADIITSVPAEKIIFEAPQPKAQMFFINQVGANVNLGNVNPNDLLLLEAQRCGLRSETFFL
jgi:phosphosulfolactate synthase